ncbi:MAG: hypothetical protein C4563_07410 [Desulfobulbus sp.]|jgi:putative membrane protein|nr:MAG: hypothetical protein C4563_07410 [Desulfobulbus sp.]
MGYCISGLPFAHGGWFFGHGPFGLLIAALLVIIVGMVLVRLARPSIGRDHAHRDSNDSLEILRVRYARGEISAEEYQRMREILNR